MNELVFLPMHRMAAMIAGKEISSVELVQAHLDHIARVNPRLNAIVELAAESALLYARGSDEHGPDPSRPLHGVPMTVKGAWDCLGLINTGGTLGRKGMVAACDATAIARMKLAGMIPIGVTNLPEFSMAFESDNLIYGRSNNPYDLARSPGGSGGGGAAAIASGCSPFEVGGDLGGSIRYPAHCCGIAGLKPTLGRVPLTGYYPGPFGVVTLMATAGPMARTVRDLILTLPLLEGPDGIDAGVCDAARHSPEDVHLSALRVAFFTDDGILASTSAVADTVRHAARAMEEAGAAVTEARPPGIETAFDLMLRMLGFDGGAGMAQLPLMCSTTQTSAFFQRLLEMLKPYGVSSAEVGALLVQRDVYRMQIAGFFRQYDVLLCPVNAYAALPHGASPGNLKAFGYTIAHNLSGCPGVSVRCGTSPEGLPIGVQVVSRHWGEHIALRVAGHLETVLGGWRPPHA